MSTAYRSPRRCMSRTQLGTSHRAASHQFDVVNVRGMHRKGPLDTDAVAFLAHGEGLTRAVALALDEVNALAAVVFFLFAVGIGMRVEKAQAG